MSGGMRDNELSLRCRAVRWVRDHRAVLRLRTLPAARDKARDSTTAVSQPCRVNDPTLLIHYL